MTLNATISRAPASRSLVSLASATILVAGFALRLLSARGDLWIDEIWTLNLLTAIGSPAEVFWNISHDNNHFLNSLWMYAVGLDGAPLLYRLPSVILGTLSIALAARIGSRTSPATGLLAGFVFAFAFPFVNYGSEARGYSGLVLAMLVAIDALDQALAFRSETRAQTEFNRHRWTLGWAIGLGTLCHLTMMMGAGILGLVAVTRLMSAHPRQPLGQMVRELTRLFLPAFVLTLPAVAAVAAGILVHGHLTVGGTSYAPGRFITGYGGMADAILGVPGRCPPWLSLCLAGAGLAASWRAGLLTASRAAMTLIGLVALPAAIALANPPNTDYPRYFLVCGIILALTMAEAAGRALRTPAGAWLVSVLLLVFMAGQTALTARLVRDGRGQVSTLVATMAGKPGSTYAAPFSTAFQLAINYHGYRVGSAIDRIALPLTCATKPDWYIADAPPDGDAPPENLSLGPDSCRMAFGKVLDVPTSSLSGRHWTLFARR